MKEDSIKLPPIGGRKQVGSKDGSVPASRKTQRSELQPLPPVNYYYVSGRYRVSRGGFWNPDLNTDYQAWLTHRRHIMEMQQRVDNRSNEEVHTRYTKFRRRLRLMSDDTAQKKIDRQNRDIESRVQNSKSCLDVHRTPFSEYVGNSFRKRFEYGQYLFQKKLNRENTWIEKRIKAARPWATVEDFVDDYTKKKQKFEHSRKFKQLEDLKTVYKRNAGKATSLSPIGSILSLHRSDEARGKKQTSKNEDKSQDVTPRNAQKTKRTLPEATQPEKPSPYAPKPIQKPTKLFDRPNNKLLIMRRPKRPEPEEVVE